LRNKTAKIAVKAIHLPLP